jgi:cytochrome c biogenesis factor
MSILVVCFWGVIFPLISELFTGQKVTVGPPFYERATAPLFSALLFLAAVAPLSAWGHSTIQTLGRALWKSALAASAVTVTLFSPINKISALIGFFLIALILFVTLQEFWRGARARQSLVKISSPPLSPDGTQSPPLWRLHHPHQHGIDGNWHHRHRCSIINWVRLPRVRI